MYFRELNYTSYSRYHVKEKTIKHKLFSQSLLVKYNIDIVKISKLRVKCIFRDLAIIILVK